jgi:hypothetical protein
MIGEWAKPFTQSMTFLGTIFFGESNGSAAVKIGVGLLPFELTFTEFAPDNRLQAIVDNHVLSTMPADCRSGK